MPYHPFTNTLIIIIFLLSLLPILPPSSAILHPISHAPILPISFSSYVCISYVKRTLFVVFLSSSLSVVPSLALFHRIQHTPRSPGSLTILIVGDWGRKGDYNQSRVASQMDNIARQFNVEFIISTGDNFYKNGLTGVDDPAFFDSYTNIYTDASLNKPWYIVLGNRDYRWDVDAQLNPALKRRDERWNCHRNYIVNVAGIKNRKNISYGRFWPTWRTGYRQNDRVADFFFIDTTPFVNKYQEKDYNWPWEETQDTRKTYLSNLLEELDTSLQESTAKRKNVVGHHTMKSGGENGETVEIVQHLLPVLEKHNVEFYFHGHDHCLQHVVKRDQSKSKLQFVTSGGGSKAWAGKFNKLDENYESKFYYDGQGFLLVRMIKAHVHNRFYDIDGNNIYKWNTR